MHTENISQPDADRDVPSMEPANLPTEIVPPADKEAPPSWEGADGWLAHALG
jgi:hypothetical protein